MRKLTIVGTAIASIVLGAVGTCMAGGTLSCSVLWRTYPATRCITPSLGNPGYNLGRLSNVTDAPVGVECPLFKTAGLETLYAKVWVVDQHPTEAITCNFRTTLPTSAGITGGTLRRVSSTGSNPVPQVLAFTDMFGIDRSAVANMDCRLPGKFSGQSSAIVAYRVGETC